MFKKLLFILLISFFISACGDILKSSWSDFRAYYNTFYNAKENFAAGYKKVQEQPVEINPSAPVRVHPAPVPAGAQEFEKAIDKGTQVLQNYSGSKWTDDALLLTGKAFYYRQEFFPALQKFEELQEYSSSSKMTDLAIIWKGRTLLDLELYSEGVEYLEAAIGSHSEIDGQSRRAEMQVLVAQHYAKMEQWERSADWLSQAIPHLKGNHLVGRTFFLYGQVLERSHRLGEAYYAYSKVGDHFAGFEYEYWSGYQQAGVARKEGNTDLALSIYEGLLKDDKHVAHHGQLAYQVARTWEIKGEIDRALTNYNHLLKDRDSRSGGLRGDIYYRLGTIYSNYFEEFSVAAAYFDSSSKVTRQPSEAQAWDTQLLAEVFDRYTNLQEQVSRTDSLLWLGSLPQTELDSVIEKVRLQKRQQLLEQRDKEEGEKLTNRTLSDIVSQRSTSSMYGFLNHQNADLVQQSQTNFHIVWGNRPLMDNWRRMDVVQRQVTRNERSKESNLKNAQDPGNRPLAETAVNTEAIPATDEQRQELREELSAYHYELGNLLLFSLNQPDKARYHFHRVLHSSSIQEDIHAKAMYSLYESFRGDYTADKIEETNLKSDLNRDTQRGDVKRAPHVVDSLNYWEKRILKEYPRSPFAQQVILSTGNQAVPSMNQDLNYKEQPDSSEVVHRKFKALLASHVPFKGAKLRAIALTYRHIDLAPYIYFKAVEDYIRQAKAKMELFASFTAFDSLPADSFQLNNSDSLQLSIDSLPVVQKELPSDYFQHSGWDSVRIVLQEFDEVFPEASQSQQIAKLREALTLN